VLALNLFQRRYQKASERKRLATLYLAMLVLAWMILVIVVVAFHWPEWLLIPFTLAVASVGVIFRRHTFPFRLRCARCGGSLDKRILFTTPTLQRGPPAASRGFEKNRIQGRRIDHSAPEWKASAKPSKN
jgi:hypothetical protein